MPTVPYAKQTWTDGVHAASAARLTVIENGIYDVSLAPAVRVYHNAAQSITSGVQTTLAFNSERFDTAGGSSSTHHDTATNNSRLTCRYAGRYMIGAHIQWSAAPTGITDVRLRLNGSTLIALVQAINDDPRIMNVTTLYELAVNDYVEVQVTQGSGGALDVSSSANLSPEFWMVRVA